MYLYLLSLTHDYTNCSKKSSKTVYLSKNFTCWPPSIPIDWLRRQTGLATNQQKQAKITPHGGPSTGASAFVVCKKQERHRPVPSAPKRWPQHRSCILGLAQRLEGSNGARTNFVSTQWIPLVLVVPESSGWVSGFEWCVFILGRSVICLYTTETHTRPQTPTYIRT